MQKPNRAVTAGAAMSMGDGSVDVKNVDPEQQPYRTEQPSQSRVSQPRE